MKLARPNLVFKLLHEMWHRLTLRNFGSLLSSCSCVLQTLESERSTLVPNSSDLRRLLRWDLSTAESEFLNISLSTTSSCEIAQYGIVVGQ